MTPVERVLADIRAVATDEHDKGDRFERLMVHAFQTDRTFTAAVHRGAAVDGLDWPGRSGADIDVGLEACDSAGPAELDPAHSAITEPEVTTVNAVVD